jgi:hypothetical protein
LKAANATERQSWQERAGVDAAQNDTGVVTQVAIAMHRTSSPSAEGARTRSESVASILRSVAAAPAAPQDGLSIRAENVLKQLAAELTGETPPKGRWTPSSELLRKLTSRDLLTARNCGPQTTDEILRWAGSQGVIIQQPFHAGKSLSAMWQDIIAKYYRGAFARAEIAEALQKSTRRKNTRIPLAFQSILVKILNSTGK